VADAPSEIEPLVDTLVFLVPLGSGKFELYSEPPDDHPTAAPSGFIRERLHRLQERWREAVHTARHREPSTSRLDRARDWAVSHVAEMVAEQRTLWSLRHALTATLIAPSNLADSFAVRDRILALARRHHGIWLIGDGLLLIGSGLFMLIPGPNVLAYYFGIRALGHYLAWRGARQAMDVTRWSARAEPALDELATLADVPRDARASRVAAIAEALQLPRLAAFFDRAAVPAR
jgi:hypothetical protein